MSACGLVLSGGGAMGSYEVGVWKALRELNIEIIAIAGTSVGALNGAMILQNDLEKAVTLWENITLDQVIDIQTRPLRKNIFRWTRNDFSLLLSTLKNVIDQGGFDTTPLRRLLEDTIDEDSIRKSPIKFGINTYSITDRVPLEFYLDQIPRGELISYLMASACLSIFKKAEIHDKKFVDGGFYDNVPINMLAKKGYKNLMVVELRLLNMRSSPLCDDLNILTLKGSSSLGHILEFTPERAKANIELGYEDTLRTFWEIGKGSIN